MIVQFPCKYSAVAFIVGILWNAGIIVGTAYIVFGLGHSGWWFLLAILFLCAVRHKEDHMCTEECKR